MNGHLRLSLQTPVVEIVVIERGDGTELSVDLEQAFDDHRPRRIVRLDLTSDEAASLARLLTRP